MIDEKTFTNEFLNSCTNLELVVLQHELRRCPEDRPYLNQILQEISRRAKLKELEKK